MKAIGAAVITLLFVYGLFLIVHAGSNPVQRSFDTAVNGPSAERPIAPKPKPEMGWKHIEVADKVFALNPGERLTWKDMKHIRVEVEAEQPVMLGAQTCNKYEPDVLKATFDCGEYDIGMLSVADERTENSVAGRAAAGLFTRSKEIVGSAIARNRVSIRFFVWSCIANCPTS